MRRFLGVAAVLTAAVAAALAADNDTPAANTTRTKKLTAKITVEFKDTYLKEALDEISGQLKDQGLGTLNHKLATGVSGNQRVSFKGEKVTVADALEGILKAPALGYVVLSQSGDRYDGALLIRQGNERGTPADAAKTPTAKEKKELKKDKPKEEPKDPPKSDDEKNEKAAASSLSLIKELIADGKKERAKERLEGLIKKYPGTKAAAEAEELLKKLN
jgi:hypothetical protein